ncbi:hypothetical protein BJF78_32270 [Pseudonocardia sp. CNS-139]|nr:hypothetical protein BJF78_32270 [Pseudonocardia sp. CNS-139]
MPAAGPARGRDRAGPAGRGPGRYPGGHRRHRRRAGRAAQIAVQFALAQVGLPYVWGGDGPAAGEVGFDCSGLTHAAYEAAGVSLPRTAHTQYHHGPLVRPGTPLMPGDLVFYGVRRASTTSGSTSAAAAW